MSDQQFASDRKQPSTAMQVLQLLKQLQDLYSWAGMTRVRGQSPMTPEALSMKTLAWLDRLKRVSEVLCKNDLTVLAPDWDDPCNLLLFFKLSARNLATARHLSVLASRALNTFGNSPPLLHRSAGRLHTFDFLSSRASVLSTHLESFQGRRDLCLLLIGPEDGVVASWLVEQYLYEKKGRADCIDLLPVLLPERALYDANTSLPSVSMSVHSRPQEGRGALFTGELEPVYDLVFLEGLRRATELGRTTLSVVEKIIASWQVLKRGGLMSVDDQLLYENPVARIIWPIETTNALETFLGLIPGQYRTVAKGFITTVQKL